MRYRSECNQLTPDDHYDHIMFNRNAMFHTTYNIYNDEVCGRTSMEQQRSRENNNNYNPYQFQQPDCNRVPPFHPNPNEMYTPERDRRPWPNHNHHNTPSHYDYTRRPNKRRPSHLMDIWRPNYDEDEVRRDRYTFSRPHSPIDRGYELKTVRFIDRPQSSRFKKHQEFHKTKTPTSTYTNKTVNSESKDKKPSIPNTSTSTKTVSNPKPKPDEPKIISDGKIAESKSAIVERVIETIKDDIPDNKSPEPQVINKTESITGILDISGISYISVDSLGNSPPSDKEKELEEKLTLQEMPSEISTKAKTVPLPVDDQETSIDIEKALKTITNHTDLTTDKTKSCVEHSSDTDDIITIDTEFAYLFTIDDIDKTKSYLDYNGVIDMDLGSPLPSVDQTNIPCMTQDELLQQLNEEIGETTSDDITTTQIKIVLDSSSIKTSSPSPSVDDTRSKVTKRSSSQTDGSGDIKKRRMSKPERRYSTYTESASPPKCKDRRASVITDRRSSTSSESSGGARSKSKSSKDPVVEPTEEVKINPYYPSLSQYKIPKKKSAFSSPDRPFCSSISELFGEYDKDDGMKSTSQEVDKDTGRIKKGCDEYSKPEQKDSKNSTIKEDVNKDAGRIKKGSDEYSRTEQKQITVQDVNKDAGRIKKGSEEYSRAEQKQIPVQEVNKDAGRSKKGSEEYFRAEQKQITSQEVNKSTGKTKKDCDEYSKPVQKVTPTIKQITSQDAVKTKKSIDYSKLGIAKEKVSIGITSKKKIKDNKISQKSNNVKEATKAAIADKSKEDTNGKIIRKSSTVKEPIKTDKQIHAKKPKSKPNTSVSSKKDIKTDKSKYLIVKENKKRILEPSNAVKQDSTTKSEKSTKGIGKSDKQKSVVRPEESKSQKNPEKRRKMNSGLDIAGKDTCHSKQSNPETQTEVNKPSSEEKVDRSQSKANNDKCDDLLSISANKNHSEPRDKINTPSAVLTDDLLPTTAEPRDKNNTSSGVLTDNLLSISPSKKDSEPADKINTPSRVLTDNLLSISPNKKHSEPRDKINTPSRVLTDNLLSISPNKKHSEPRDKISTPIRVLTDDLLSITPIKYSESKDNINTPSVVLTDDLLSITPIKQTELRDKINTSSAVLTDDLLSITPIKHSEPRDNINTHSVVLKVNNTSNALPDSPDECLEANYEKLLSLVTSRNLTVEETRSEASKNVDTSVDANAIDNTDKSSNGLIDRPLTANNATITSPARNSESIDSNRLIELLNKYFPVVPEPEVASKAPDLQQTTNVTEDDKSEPIKKETTLNPSDIQIKNAVKLEHPDLEKVQPLILDPFPSMEKPRITLVENDCIERAFVMDSPDLHENVETVVEEKKEKENDSQDVIEIKENITVIDLTVEPEEIVVKEDLLQIIEDMDRDSTEKITLYRSEEPQENAGEDEEVQAMSASLLPSAVLHTNKKPEPIKSEENFNRQIVTENENYTNISSPESVANTSTEVQAKKENIVNTCKFAESTNDETSNSNSSDSLPPLLKAKSFLSINKNLFEKDANVATEGNSDTLQNGVEVSAGQTSSGSSIIFRALNMPDVLPTTAPLAPASSSSLLIDGSVTNSAVSSADRTQEWPSAPSSSAISVSVLNGVQTDRTQACASTLSSSAISVPNNSVPAVSVLNGVQASRTQNSSSINVPSNSVPAVNRTQEWARGGASILNTPAATVSVSNATVSSANQSQGWIRNDVPLLSFSVPISTVPVGNQTEQWAAKNYASVSSSSAVGVSVPNNDVPPANRTQQWTRSGGTVPNVTVVNQTHGWTGSNVSSVSQQQTTIPSEHWPSRTFNDVQSGSHNQNRSTSTASNETIARGPEKDHQQVNTSSSNQMPSLSSSPSHNGWHHCMADLVVLAIRNHNLGKQNLKASNVCPMTYKVEQLVIDFRWKIYGEQIMRFLSNTYIEEVEPIQNIVTIYQRVQSHGLSSLPQFFLCLDAIMSQTKEFYLNHPSLWKFYQLVNANAKEIRLKANKSVQSTPPRPVLTQQQIGTLNTQIDFCNMITKSYQTKSTPKRSSPLTQNSFTVHQKAPARQSRASAQVARNVGVSQQTPNMYNTMLPPQRANQQYVIQQQRFPAMNTPTQSSLNANVYAQSSSNHIGNSTPYSNVLKQLLNGKQPAVSKQPSNSTFKVPSQLRYVRKNLPSSSTAVNDPPTNAPVPSYGMSPAYNAPVQNSSNDSNAPPFRRDTPRYVMPPMTHIRKHIYAPMMFTPNYPVEKTPSPVNESPAPPRYQSPSHESPINVLPNKEMPAISPIESTRNRMPITGSSINTPINQLANLSINQTSFNELPVNERVSLQSPINERVALQSPINELGVLQSPINELGALQSPINDPGALQSPINDPGALQSPIDDPGALQSPINEQGALESPVNAPPASPSPVIESPANRAPVNESIDNGEPCDSETKVNEVDEVVIDLTWLDDFDCDELKEEVDFITVKKEEFDEDEVVLNEEQFPLASSPTDSGIESSPSPQVEYSELVYHGRLCICEQPAEYVCECRLAMYCSNSCQNRDWTQHRRICLKAKSKQTD